MIDEPFVSSTHARFSLQGPALVLEDLGSTNGTLVNGKLIDQPVTLRETESGADRRYDPQGRTSMRLPFSKKQQADTGEERQPRASACART